MQSNIEPPGGASGRFSVWRVVGWSGMLFLLLTPLIAMQFYPTIQWHGTDFMLAAVILGIGGALVELTSVLTPNQFARAGAFVAITASIIVFGANIAVGMIGDEGEPINLLFGIVLFVAIAGGWLSSLHSLILPTFMAAAGTIQAAIGLFAGILGHDAHGGVLTILLALMWWISAGLFLVALKRRHRPS
jgi:hypothetical protein